MSLLTCPNCGVKFRLKPGMLRSLKEFPCTKCRTKIPIPQDPDAPAPPEAQGAKPEGPPAGTATAPPLPEAKPGTPVTPEVEAPKPPTPKETPAAAVQEPAPAAPPVSTPAPTDEAEKVAEAPKTPSLAEGRLAAVERELADLREGVAEIRGILSEYADGQAEAAAHAATALERLGEKN
jgi:hypothetical protein